MEGLSLAAAVAKMADSRWGSQSVIPLSGASPSSSPHVTSAESGVGSLAVPRRRLSHELKNG
eukprot:CAMPEP_0194344866 /NCGR_PEP_ID=MMETSP0171-20130528/103311_1 /TAXON_ID=218684 /ORGANISM="Corethron pennatum, Strain L29A3" /LENGTH=61 /DNA_ID=CAMNT_0039111711 /DNA_START=117 /DNA_END=298 /DNA_ORIENTATION=+